MQGDPNEVCVHVWADLCACAQLAAGHVMKRQVSISEDPGFDMYGDLSIINIILMVLIKWQVKKVFTQNQHWI